MNINHLEIDNYLIENAIKLSGLKDTKKLIEEALLVFTQQLKKQPHSSQEILNNFYQLPISEIETIDTVSVYQGTVLSLDKMQQAIEYEAGFHK